MNNNTGIPTTKEINQAQTPPFEFCQAVFLRIHNKSHGVISYSFGGAKMTLEPGESDPYPSPQNPMTGKIEFSIPPTTQNIKIRIFKIEIK